MSKALLWSLICCKSGNFHVVENFAIFVAPAKQVARKDHFVYPSFVHLSNFAFAGATCVLWDIDSFIAKISAMRKLHRDTGIKAY